jgi:hypothetical protein
MTPSLMSPGAVDCRTKTGGSSQSCAIFFKSLGVCHTILVADRLADADARLVVGVLKDHDLGQINSQTMTDIVSVVCAAACWAIVHAVMEGQKFFVCARASGVNDDGGSK